MARPNARTSRRRVAITGVGPVCPIGVGAEAFWTAIAAGTSGTEALEELPGGFSVQSLRSKVVARVKDEALPEPERARADRRAYFAELSARLALADADLEDLRRGATAVVCGNAVGSPLAVDETFRRAFIETQRLPEGELPGLMRDLSFHTVADELAASHGCDGPALTVSTGCTASLDAVGLAYELVRDGSAEVVLTGSAEAPLSPIVFASFDVIGAMTRQNHRPARASRPFDKERDGFVLGEGAAMMVLEDLEHARARGVRIYGEVVAYASTSSAYHMTNLAADGASLARSFALALEYGGLAPGDIDHVNAHGSSTPQNDLFETNAIKRVLGDRASQITVNSLKAMLGHALGASNALELVACAQMLDRQHLFPTINLDQPGAGCDLDYVPNEGRGARIGHIAKFGNGFSGIHSVLVMRAHA